MSKWNIYYGKNGYPTNMFVNANNYEQALDKYINSFGFNGNDTIYSITEVEPVENTENKKILGNLL